MTKPLKRTLTELTDTFQDEVMFGEVIGSHSSDHSQRLGVDLEAKVSIDNGALRFDPLDQPGWGRQGVVYGPFQRRAGLAFASFLLNGHNNSQGLMQPQPPKPNRQAPTVNPVPNLAATKAHSKAEALKANFSVGWFTDAISQNPLENSHAFVIKGNGRSNGELWASMTRGMKQLLVGLANNPVYLVALLRESGVAFYAGSVEGSRHLPALPKLRPIAIDPYGPVEEELYAGIYQSILGEAGHRADTRIYGVRVGEVADWSRWYATAHAADRQPQLGRKAVVGGTWSLVGNHMLLKPSAPSGLIHARLTPPLSPQSLEQNPNTPTSSVVWRYLDSQNYLTLEQTELERKKGRFDKAAANLLETRLRLRYGGQDFILATNQQETLGLGEPRWVHILDDGQQIMVLLDGKALFGEHGVSETRLAEACGVGLRGAVGDLEAHPREVELPAELNLGMPWQPEAKPTAYQEEFNHWFELRSPWQCNLGEANLSPIWTGLQVGNSSTERTLYTLPWGKSTAELEAEITPAALSRVGLCFYQDPQHYLTVSLELGNGESNVVGRLRFSGFESRFDQVWTRVPHLLKAGQKTKLRVVCDGERFQVYLNNEAVLYRAFSDIYPGANAFNLSRVGFVAGGKGSDTGSVFHQLAIR